MRRRRRSRAPTVVSGTTQPVGIVTGRCYTYTLTGTDNVGNSTTISTTVKVDTTAPVAPTITALRCDREHFSISGTTVFINPQAGNSGSFTATATSTDGDSGIQKLAFPALTGFSSGEATTRPRRTRAEPTTGLVRSARWAPRP